jgi:outer membrane biosynthesis protein TonB
MNTINISSEWVGHVIDNKYPLLKWLGGAGDSGVFLTELQGPGSQRAAIKVIPADYAKGEVYIARWRVAAELSHPNLMRLLHMGRSLRETEGLVYVVTEYAEEVLAQTLRERTLEPEKLKDWLVSVTDGLFYLHRKGYVHGHVKPSNIMVVGNQVQLSTDCMETAGEPARNIGVLSVYDAPEVGERALTSSADIWSLGMTLVEALTQSPARWARAANREPELPAGIPQPFARMAEECLQIDPTHRCTLADLNQAMYEDVRCEEEPVDRDSGMFSSWRMSDVETELSGSKRNLKLGVVAALAVIVVVGLALMRSHRTAAPPAVRQKTGPVVAQQTKPVDSVGQQPKPVAPPVPNNEPAAAAPESVTAGSEPAGTDAAKPVAPGALAVEAAAKKSVAPSAQAKRPAARAEAQDAQEVAESNDAGQLVQMGISHSTLNAIHGTVQVKIQVAVNASGKVFDARFENAGSNNYFAGLAMGAAQRWQFEPVVVNGQQEASAWLLEFNFRRTGVRALARLVGP